MHPARVRVVWYNTLRALHQTSNFADMVAMTTQSAGALYGAGSKEEKVVAKAWKDVGF